MKKHTPRRGRANGRCLILKKGGGWPVGTANATREVKIVQNKPRKNLKIWYSNSMKENKVKIDSEVMANNRWAIVVDIDGNDLVVMNEDGHEFQITLDQVNPIN